MKKDYNKKIKDIIKLVCEETGVTYVELCSRRRTANLLKARAIYVAVCLKLTDFSLEEIGNTISKNHGTISRYAKKNSYKHYDDHNYGVYIHKLCRDITGVKWIV